MKRKLILFLVFTVLSLFSMSFLANQSTCFGASEKKEVALDFDDVDIRLFIRVISELTGKNFIIDNNVRGKVTVISPTKLSTEQAYEVFKSVLAVNGFTIVETGKVAKIVPIQNINGLNLPVSTRRVVKSEDQFITQIIPLKFLNAKLMIPILKPMLSRQGNILAPPSSDMLIVTDTKSNIRKIEKVLDEIDLNMVNEIIDRLDLKYSTASLIAPKVTEVLNSKYGKARKGAREVLFKIVPLDRINALIVVASPDVMMEIRSIISKIDQPTPEGKGMLNVYYLENADAEEMVKILTQTKSAFRGVEEKPATASATAQKTEAGGRLVSGSARVFGKDITITADKSTNSLIIYAKPDDYNALKEIIKKLDIPRKQVYIQALIMEVSPNEDFNFGTEWAMFKDVGHPFTSDARTGIFGSSRVEGGSLDQLTGGGAGTIDLGNGFSMGILGESIRIGDFSFPSFELMVKAVESLKTTNILSKPQLMTLNNETATINISTNRPFQTTSTIIQGGGSTQNIEYRDVGIKLEITPHINKKGKIRLEINQEVSKLSGTVAENQPITLKRAIDTVVEVNNGGTIVIGGLIEKQRDFTRNAVPCLGGIPLLGWAFKTVGISDTATNLLVFIHPRVFETPEEAHTLSIEKKRYMEKQRSTSEQKIESEKPFFMEYEKKTNTKEQKNKQKEEKK